MRRFVIGDIHGCGKALRTLIDTIDPGPDDEIIFLGDYIDRGPNSRDVVQQVLDLSERCQVVALRGNHEIMLLGVALGGLDDTVWLENGGVATVTSYGGLLTKIPPEHLEVCQNLEPYYETHNAIFVHAGYNHELDMHEQESATSFWHHLPYPLPMPHKSGKRVFVGHTPQASGDVLDGGHIVCVDTYCFGGGYLTAFETSTCEIIQADRHGHLRRAPMQVFVKRLGKIYETISGIIPKRKTRVDKRDAKASVDSPSATTDEASLDTGAVET